MEGKSAYHVRQKELETVNVERETFYMSQTASSAKRMERTANTLVRAAAQPLREQGSIQKH